MCELVRSTTIVEPGVLDVGIKVETYTEELSNQKYFIYYQIVTWFGMDKAIQLHTNPTYLMGAYEGFEQTMKVEVPHDVLEEVIEHYHVIGETTAKELKDYFKLQFFVEMARQMGWK